MLSKLPKTKFYHASPRRFRHGDILVGGQKGGYGYAHDFVCMTTSPAIHGTVADLAMKENWHVYEVKPSEDVGLCHGNGELQASTATVLRCIGRVSSFLHKPSKGARYCRYWKVYMSTVPSKPHRGVKSLPEHLHWRGRW